MEVMNCGRGVSGVIGGRVQWSKRKNEQLFFSVFLALPSPSEGDD
jgi:hypothetical protein